MTQVKMKALDTLHISALGPDNLAPGEQFEVSEDVAASLETRGLATRISRKAAPAPANKARKAAPANKSRRAKGAN